MNWLPDDFFIGHPAPPQSSPTRPLGQGDVFLEVPVAGRTGVRNGQPGLRAKLENVIVVGSSCGIRKEGGELNDVIHVAPIKHLASMAPGWGPPWSGWLHVLPLPGLEINGEGDWAANLARIGLAGTDTLTAAHRVASVSQQGMEALKARVATYFVRADIPTTVLGVGAHEEWHELDLWERWVERTGAQDGFQQWLDEENPNYPGRRRRDTLYDDLAGVRQQLDETTA
ncbi:MAG: hypothetical protein M5U27_11040 [Gaiella sp.]|nr:hypothetical protein [Gaiella sp.]